VRALKDSGAISSIPEGRIVPVAIGARLPGVGIWSYRVAYDVLAAVAAWHLPWRRELLLLAPEPMEFPTAV